MKNIFEGCTFGTVFITKKGLKASFVTMNEKSAFLIIEDGSILSHYNLDGTISCNGVEDYEIVGRETIDERNMRLLAKNSDGVCDACTDEEKEKMMKQYIEGYKDGFYKTHWK